jgi:proline dehydrogenase
MGLRKLIKPAIYLALTAISRNRAIGEDMENARTVAVALRSRGYDVTLAYWNGDGESPTAVISKYEDAMDAVGAIGGGAYLSIKAPAFGCDADLYEALRTRANQREVALHFDALGPEFADQTLSLVTDHCVGRAPAIGCTLPGRWKRSPVDADRLAPLGVAIRVVKGEWPDPQAPDLDPSEGFLDVVAQLAGRAGQVRIATHDPDLARSSIRMLRQAGTPCDLEVLYGFPIRRLLPQLRDVDVPIRVYVPFGHGWLPYSLARVRARPALLWWLVRETLSGEYLDGFSTLVPPR